jgi:hypothetical protein
VTFLLILTFLGSSSIIAAENQESREAVSEEQTPDQAEGQELDRDQEEQSVDMETEPESRGLTAEQKEILLGAGLSSATVSDLDLLYQDPNRTRPPALTVDEILKLVEAGLPDDKIRLLIGLDALSGQEEEIPVSPENVRELASSGLSVKTIGAMLLGEISRLIKKRPRFRKSKNGWEVMERYAPKGKKTGLEERKEFAVEHDSQAEIDHVRLGRQVATRPDGKQVVVYRSPFDDHKTELGRKVYIKPDGKQTIVYGFPGKSVIKQERSVINRPDGKQVIVFHSSNPQKHITPEEAQKRQLEFALEILSRINPYINMNQYFPGGGGGRPLPD